MNYHVYLGFFLLSTVKFLFAPFGGILAQLTFFETYFSCVAGALFSATLFYFSSEYFMKRARDKKRQQLLNGQVKNEKKKFTRTNKGIVKLKSRFGKYGIAFFAPLILSIPLGTIITAKFYGRENGTYLLIILGIVVNGLITTGIHYGSALLFE